MSDFPTGSLGEFVVFLIMLFIIYLAIYGIAYGGVEIINFLLNWGRY